MPFSVFFFREMQLVPLVDKFCHTGAVDSIAVGLLVAAANDKSATNSNELAVLLET